MDDLKITIDRNAVNALTIDDLGILGQFQTGSLPLNEMIEFLKQFVVEDIGKLPAVQLRAIVQAVSTEIATIFDAGN